MVVESHADRLMFLSAGDFGCTFLHTPQMGGGAVPDIPGVFDEDFLDQNTEGQSSIATRSPRMTCATASLLSGGLEGDQITIQTAPSQPDIVGRVYQITTPRADGTGMSLLWLERVL